MTDLEAAAERLLKHDHGRDQQNSPYFRRGSVVDVVKMQADRDILTDFAAPLCDGTPITEDWLRSAGWITAANPEYLDLEGDQYDLGWGIKHVEFVLSNACFRGTSFGGEAALKITTRGQLRLLCAALQIPLKEPS